MSSRTPIPPSLGERFSVAHAQRLGIGTQRLRSRDLAAPFPGVRRRAEVLEPSDLRARCLDYAPRLRPGQFFSHETALLLLGVPLPPFPYQPSIHIATHRPAREPRVRGVIGHRLQLREPATVTTIDGLPVEHPVRAWRQAGADWPLDALIAAADHLVHVGNGLATIDDLRDEADVMGDRRDGILRRALAWTRVGVESPRETALRLAIVRSGLPEPVPGWELRDGRRRFVARLDLAYPRWRIATEYDGRQHAEDPAQFARDADRWDAVRREGWTLVRVLSHHMGGRAEIATGRVREALIDAGWRPGMSG
ncbi:hypothetical protein J2Y69_003248 [Microbacterium resistens]|uniref:DUF559 domain-containing protein n=1 Tax=Microbacterium resistens TaxID=156977 RepID=A0ABU1SGF8_9MICO|nr:hypothetical protein [Microbacterium resistens]MDR6868624.1 hypothetical protein [Microbacterium resistens]